METTYMNPDLTKKVQLLAETTTLDAFVQSFDLSAFPLPMRLTVERHMVFCGCQNYTGETVHVRMQIKPRNASELRGVERDADGTISLKTCAGVSAETFQKEGAFQALEKTRVAIKNMVMHEVYEALLYRGERIMNPHDDVLRPSDQPF